MLRRHGATLQRWAYSDGTVFFLDRSEEELASGQRAALGCMAWRRADRSDALRDDCVGPSTYQKGQGTPVRVWGLLAAGILHIYVFPKSEVMNRWWYAWLVERRFPQWLEGTECITIVQDYEKCLRCDEPLAAMQTIGVALLEEHPKYSQDLSAIENAWRELRDRLAQTMPPWLESRDDFIVRLRYAVTWLNANRHDQLLKFCTNQKERAKDVLALRGSRTKW